MRVCINRYIMSLEGAPGFRGLRGENIPLVELTQEARPCDSGTRGLLRNRLSYLQERRSCPSMISKRRGTSVSRAIWGSLGGRVGGLAEVGVGSSD